MNKRLLAFLLVFILIFSFAASCDFAPTVDVGSQASSAAESRTASSAASSAISSQAGAHVSSEESASENESRLLVVSFIDVGQGDGILIRTPDDKFILVDCGPAEAEKSFIAFLKSQNVREFEYVFFTHPHADHIGNAVKVLQEFKVKNVYMPDAATTTKTFTNLLNELDKQKDIKITQAKAGQKITVGEVNIDILSPSKDKYGDLNEYSIVFKLTYKENSILFTGDAYIKNEKEMIAASYDLKADILKVGHHGSDSSTSTEFLNAVQPKYAVISCGLDNSFGHPHKSTLERIASAGAKIYRTDNDGTITLYANGVEIVIKSEK
ncbi:MAG TPA: ComEC/Rec2 family competence protein [Bacillota bacterium]|nr:ComEC/Rec2 family competence protein [Bacillota bacterium]HOK68240.1 ComEC/Rec2 family competence protein [Bacillota bacterium]HPP84455.1 ComEC/Rec2 family competence protein [Bacillota bacterium]